MIAQIIFLAGVFIFLIMGLGKRGAHGTKAWKKIALLLLVLAMVIAILSPEITNTVAHSVGIGRGADLLLYALVFAFVFYALNSYLEQQDQRDSLFRLARQIAILDAKNRYESRINKKVDNRG